METVENTSSQNLLYPVFFKLDKLKMLIVGAGEVGHEKLSFIIKSSPNANIKIVATWVSDEVQHLVEKFPNQISVDIKPVEIFDLVEHDLIVSATNFKEVNLKVYGYAKALGKLINVADTPELCDFYLGSIVTRGDLKVAISTNGKSPTFAKRFRQILEDILPNDTNDLLQNLFHIRNQLKLNFEQKVEKLNEITKTLIEK